MAGVSCWLVLAWAAMASMALADSNTTNIHNLIAQNHISGSNVWHALLKHQRQHSDKQIRNNFIKPQSFIPGIFPLDGKSRSTEEESRIQIRDTEMMVKMLSRMPREFKHKFITLLLLSDRDGLNNLVREMISFHKEFEASQAIGNSIFSKRQGVLPDGTPSSPSIKSAKILHRISISEPAKVFTPTSRAKNNNIRDRQIKNRNDLLEGVDVLLIRDSQEIKEPTAMDAKTTDRSFINLLDDLQNTPRFDNIMGNLLGLIKSKGTLADLVSRQMVNGIKDGINGNITNTESIQKSLLGESRPINFQILEEDTLSDIVDDTEDLLEESQSDILPPLRPTIPLPTIPLAGEESAARFVPLSSDFEGQFTSNAHVRNLRTREMLKSIGIILPDNPITFSNAGVGRPLPPVGDLGDSATSLLNSVQTGIPLPKSSPPIISGSPIFGVPLPSLEDNPATSSDVQSIGVPLPSNEGKFISIENSDFFKIPVINDVPLSPTSGVPLPSLSLTSGVPLPSPTNAFSESAAIERLRDLFTSGVPLSSVSPTSGVPLPSLSSGASLPSSSTNAVSEAATRERLRDIFSEFFINAARQNEASLKQGSESTKLNPSTLNKLDIPIEDVGKSTFHKPSSLAIEIDNSNENIHKGFSIELSDLSDSILQSTYDPNYPKTSFPNFNLPTSYNMPTDKSHQKVTFLTPGIMYQFDGKNKGKEAFIPQISNQKDFGGIKANSCRRRTIIMTTVLVMERPPKVTTKVEHFTHVRMVPSYRVTPIQVVQTYSAYPPQFGKNHESDERPPKLHDDYSRQKAIPDMTYKHSDNYHKFSSERTKVVHYAPKAGLRYGEKSHTPHTLASPEYQLPPKPEYSEFSHIESGGRFVPTYEMLTLPASFGEDYYPQKPPHHFKRKNKFGYKSRPFGKNYRSRYHRRAEKWTKDGSGSSSWEQRDSSKKRPSFRENFSRKNRDAKRNNSPRDIKKSPPSSYNSRTNRHSEKKNSDFSSFHFQSQNNKASRNDRNGKHRQMSSPSTRYSRKVNPAGRSHGKASNSNVLHLEPVGYGRKKRSLETRNKREVAVKKLQSIEMEARRGSVIDVSRNEREDLAERRGSVTDVSRSKRDGGYYTRTKLVHTTILKTITERVPQTIIKTRKIISTVTYPVRTSTVLRTTVVCLRENFGRDGSSKELGFLTSGRSFSGSNSPQVGTEELRKFLSSLEASAEHSIPESHSSHLKSTPPLKSHFLVQASHESREANLGQSGFQETKLGQLSDLSIEDFSPQELKFAQGNFDDLKFSVSDHVRSGSQQSPSSSQFRTWVGTLSPSAKTNGDGRQLSAAGEIPEQFVLLQHLWPKGFILGSHENQKLVNLRPVDTRNKRGTVNNKSKESSHNRRVENRKVGVNRKGIGADIRDNENKTNKILAHANVDQKSEQ